MPQAALAPQPPAGIFLWASPFLWQRTGAGALGPLLLHPAEHQGRSDSAFHSPGTAALSILLLASEAGLFP